jgi:uncharacterized protein YgiB involved in biofilm formation
MRKSTYITILLGGAAALAIWTLADSDKPVADDTKLYGDAEACTKDFNADECNRAQAAAKEEHVKQAPKFATAAECEAAGFTTCETAQVRTADGGSTSFFMPMMMGYMMSRALGGGGMGGYGLQPRPVYAYRGGFLYANGATVGQVAPGTTSLGSNAVPMRTASRGGFGATAGRFSGGS